MVQHHSLCIVIADGGHARFVHPAEDNGLHTAAAVDSTDVHKRTHDLVSDRPGRAFESGSATRHAYTPRHDAQDLAKTRFAHLVAERINEECAAGQFNELVLVAPPHILAELTDGLDAKAKAMVLGTLPKDLVKVPDHELQPHLKQWVRPVQRA